MDHRLETDAYGAVEIATWAYWGPQTERSRKLFAIGDEATPAQLIHCFGAQKAAAARANMQLGLLPEREGAAIVAAAEEMRDGAFDAHFPIALWQTGSGTQTNMNANEVIANRANEMLGAGLGVRKPVHPNDYVNMGQSSNDTFPTVMHLGVLRAVRQSLAPAVRACLVALDAKAEAYRGAVKPGMTHLQDALPITLGSEFSVWSRQIGLAWGDVDVIAGALSELPQGGTASGSGVNGNPRFARLVCDNLRAYVGRDLYPSPMPSHLMASHDRFQILSGALQTLASALLKLCNDIRLLTSSLGERPMLLLPDEGLSSSIMPAKRNATVCEAVAQVCFRVIGNNASITAANASSTLQLNTAKPLIISAVLNSIELLSDALRVMASGCIDGLEADLPAMKAKLEGSPVLGAVLAPMVGYDRAARIIRTAAAEGLSILELLQRDGVDGMSDATGVLRAALEPARLTPGAAEPLENKDET